MALVGVGYKSWVNTRSSRGSGPVEKKPRKGKGGTIRGPSPSKNPASPLGTDVGIPRDWDLGCGRRTFSDPDPP